MPVVITGGQELGSTRTDSVVSGALNYFGNGPPPLSASTADATLSNVVMAAAAAQAILRI
jgi:hypothetical protein